MNSLSTHNENGGSIAQIQIYKENLWSTDIIRNRPSGLLWSFKQVLTVVTLINFLVSKNWYKSTLNTVLAKKLHHLVAFFKH